MFLDNDSKVKRSRPSLHLRASPLPRGCSPLLLSVSSKLGSPGPRLWSFLPTTPQTFSSASVYQWEGLFLVFVCELFLVYYLSVCSGIGMLSVWLPQSKYCNTFSWYIPLAVKYRLMFCLEEDSILMTWFMFWNYILKWCRTYYQ